jgi:hypothetical protein
MDDPNKLECLYLSRPFKPCLLCAGKARSLSNSKHLILDWKESQTNTQAYLRHLPIAVVKSFITLAPFGLIFASKASSLSLSKGKVLQYGRLQPYSQISG